MTHEKPRIFVVEDEVLVAFEMSDALEDMGFEVVGPSIHLEHAKRLARSGDIDAAFLDVNLGSGRTSRAVVEILRERNIPYAFITAYDPGQVGFIGPDDRVLKKPASARQLLDALRRIRPGMLRQGKAAP